MSEVRAGDVAEALRMGLRAAPGAVLAMAGAALVAGVGPVVLAWLTRDLLDRLVAGAVPLLLAFAVAGIGVVLASVPHAMQYTSNELDRRLSLCAQERLFSALQRHVGLQQLEDPAFQDRVQLAGTAGRSAPAQVVSGSLGLLSSAAALAGFLATLIALSPIVAAVVVAASAPAVVAHLRLGRRHAAVVTGSGHAQRRQLFYARLLTTAEAAKEVRLFGLGDFFRGRMLADLGSVNAAERRVDRSRLRTQVLLGAFGAVVAGGGLVWLTGRAATGAYTVGDLTVFVVAVAGVQAAVAQGIAQVAAMLEAQLLFAHFMFVVRSAPPAGVPEAALRPAPLRDGIVVHDVWFRYSDDHDWVLRGVDLRIPQGAAVALVGLNGAGKSTLVKLLCRFHEPTRGRITWDGVDLRDLDPELLRRRMAVVFQDFQDYDLPARENIGVGDVRRLDDLPRITAAARLAGVHATLAALPDGYDTPLTRLFFWAGDTGDPRLGVRLSGGQWQRVALARALLRDDSDLMILDEPSSGLDAEAEAEIHRALRAHRAGRATLLISHRLSTLRDADVVAVLAEGRVAELGSHDELMRADGRYARLFRLQAQGYQLEPA
ncbi:ABC transporter ATP-binding protein [Dactylosporangium sp. NPDC000521]|uniref:ABC transporter ATP-binding protein n=1 Tax=Dactylosporangium sp. NPDC000521 TaxID=3363975 RepID=UPI003697D478